MSAGKFLGGFLIGGAVGALVGLLLAPQSGEETREMLGDKAKDIKQKAEGTVKEIQSRADEIVEDLQNKGDAIVNKIQGFINHVNKNSESLRYLFVNFEEKKELEEIEKSSK